jgi:hypothetical protein
MLTFFFDTTNKRITSVTRRAGTNGIVVDNIATCIRATDTRTRVSAFLCEACSVLRTVCTDNTFGLARRRSANVSGFAGANSVSIDGPALAVWTAR